MKNSMLRLRLWTAMLIGGLVLLFTVVQFDPDLPLSFTGIALLGITAIATAAVPFVGARAVGSLVIGWVGVLIVVKLAFAKASLGVDLSSTIFESTLVGIAAIASKQLHSCLSSIDSLVRETAALRLGGDSTAVESGHNVLYREIRRARDHNRPVTLMAVAPLGPLRSIVVSEMLNESQEKLIARMTLGRLAAAIAEELQDYDVILGCDDHLMLLFPELSEVKVTQVIAQLRSTARNDLGLDLCLGSAIFPDQEVTLAGMLGRARSQMEDDRQRRGRNSALAPKKVGGAVAGTIGSHVKARETSQLAG